MQRVVENLEKKLLNFPGCQKNFQKILYYNIFIKHIHNNHYIPQKSSIGHISNCRFEAYRNNFRSQEIQCTWSFCSVQQFYIIRYRDHKSVLFSIHGVKLLATKSPKPRTHYPNAFCRFSFQSSFLIYLNGVFRVHILKL